MVDFTSFLNGLLGGVLASLAVAKLLAKWLVQHQLDKSLKSHEAHLTAKADVLKTQLSMYAHEQNVAVARVDSQRAQALHAIYGAISEWSRPVVTLVNGSPLRNVDEAAHLSLYFKLCEEAHAGATKLCQALQDNAIYVDTDLYTELADLADCCGISVATVLAPMRQGHAEGWPIPEVFARVEEERESFQKEYKANLLPSIQRITQRFRETLGIQRPEVP